MQYLFLLLINITVLFEQVETDPPGRPQSASSYTGCSRISYLISTSNVVYFVSVGCVTRASGSTQRRMVGWLVTETAWKEAVVT
jgi:hypothetical protein